MIDENRESNQAFEPTPEGDGPQTEAGTAAGGTPGPAEESLEELRQAKEDLYDRLLRTQADFENFRKRTSREKKEVRLAAQADVITSLLPSLDACEKGLESLKEASDTPGLETYREGYELLLKEIRSVLSKFDDVPVPGAGSAFDPNVHEAVVREVTTEYQDGQILEEFRKGYLIKDRLLRPSQVRVAIQPEEVSTEGRED